MAIPVSLRRVWLNQKARAGELAQSQPAQENPFFRFAESRKSHGTGRELERQSRQKKQERPVVPSALGERLGFWVDGTWNVPTTLVFCQLCLERHSSRQQKPLHGIRCCFENEIRWKSIENVYPRGDSPDPRKPR
jgi:hypothetical protein